MTVSQFHIYGDIQKFDTDGESLLVSGILSTPDEDKQGEVVTADAMRKALGDYLLNGTCREMHQPIAAGKPISAYVDDDGKTHLTVKVVDKGTIAKVKEGVLKGFSIGGKAIKKVGKKIVELALREASLVDIPANPQCIFEIVKFDKPGDKCNDPECDDPTEAKCDCGAKMSKGMKKCKKCMEKSNESEELDNPHEKSMKKMLCAAMDLPETTPDSELQAALAKRLKQTANATDASIIAKLDETAVQVKILAKAASDATAMAQEGQRKSIIQKMQRDSRVAMKNETTAYTVDELQKMDLGTLEILAVNSPKLPTQAAHVYKSEGYKPRIPVGQDGKRLQGDNLIETALADSGYGSLEQMNARFSN